MTHKCRCGGRIRRTDIVGSYDPKYKMVLYHDTDRKVAHFACNSCLRVYTQRKRQPAGKAPERMREEKVQ